MFLDGSTTLVQFYKSTKHSDNIIANFGNSNDAQLYHSGTNCFINNNTGNLYITNYSDNKDIIFRSDDGSGGVATYFFLDGSQGTVSFEKNARWQDGKLATFGDADDLQIYHDGSNSYINESGTGLLKILTNGLEIKNSADNGYMAFFGSTGAAELYYNTAKKFETTSTGVTVTGGIEVGGAVSRFSNSTRFTANATFDDNSKAIFGDDSDLQIYHTGSASIVGDFGTGNLSVRGDNLQLHRADGSQRYFQGVTGGSATMYHAGNPKIETTSTGTKTTGQMDLAALNSAPSSASDTGTVGEIRFTSDYIYVCVASNTWKRAALSTW